MLTETQYYQNLLYEMLDEENPDTSVEEILAQRWEALSGESTLELRYQKTRLHMFLLLQGKVRDSIDISSAGDSIRQSSLVSNYEKLIKQCREEIERLSISLGLGGPGIGVLKSTTPTSLFS